MDSGLVKVRTKVNHLKFNICVFVRIRIENENTFHDLANFKHLEFDELLKKDSFLDMS